MAKKKGNGGKENPKVAGYDSNLSEKDTNEINKFISSIIDNAARDMAKAGLQAGVPIMFGFNFQVDSMPIHTSIHAEQHAPSQKPGEPLVDIIESPGKISIIAEMPGTRQGDIEVASDGNNLMITSKSVSRPYMKTIKLPRQLRKGSITFNCRNGIVEVCATTV
jgi:HSP20 family molecular chaperone IbpA